VYDPNPDRRTFDIHSYDLESGEREIAIGQASQPAISPNGKRIVFRSWDIGRRGLLVRELTDGNTWPWVTFHEAEHGRWSPDNQNITFSSQQQSDRQWRLYRTLGLDILMVQRQGGDVFGRVPTWSPDGRIIYWECPMNNCGLYSIHTDGTNLSRLTGNENDTTPTVSPDGKQVVFMSTSGGDWDLYLVGSVAPAGGSLQEPRALTDNPARDGLPTWSPDGRWVAFVSDRGGAWAVWAVRPDGSNLQKLFDLGGRLEGEIANIPPSEQHGWAWESIAWAP
jgi:Tol biopolymer transport system component